MKNLRSNYKSLRFKNNDVDASVFQVRTSEHVICTLAK